MASTPEAPLGEHAEGHVDETRFPPSARSAAFLEAILAGDRQRANREACLAFEEAGPAYLVEGLVRPALEAVGELWQLGRISVADEHLATATAQTAMAALYARFPWPPPGPAAVVACVEGERHEVGARMVADLLALDGWHDVFLGSDTPLAALVDKVTTLEPVFVALSVTLPRHVAIAEDTIRQLRATAPSVKILVGGRAITPATAKRLAADRMATSAREAVDAVRAWKRSGEHAADRAARG